MMHLFVVRHGETMENANNCLVGRLNTSLTEKGIDQAKQVSEYFKDKNITRNKFYSNYQEQDISNLNHRIEFLAQEVCFLIL